MAVLYGTTQQGQLVPVEADAQGRLVAQLDGDPPKYQQGTWTPTLTQGTCVPTDALWTRIGNRVEVQGRLTDFSDKSNPDPIGIPWAALPYLPVTPTAQLAVGVCSVIQIGRTVNITSLQTGGVPQVRFIATAVNESSNITSARYSDLGVSPVLAFQLSYLTEDTSWTPSSGSTTS